MSHLDTSCATHLSTFVDKNTYNTTRALFNSQVQVIGGKQAAAGIAIKIRVDNQYEAIIDINQIQMQGLGQGTSVFRCPARSCGKSFSRRHCVKRHVEHAHQKQHKTDKAGWWKSHPTMSSYEYHPSKLEYKRRPRAEVEKEKAENGGHLKARVPKTQQGKRKRVANGNEQADDEKFGGLAHASIAVEKATVDEQDSGVQIYGETQQHPVDSNVEQSQIGDKSNQVQASSQRRLVDLIQEDGLAALSPAINVERPSKRAKLTTISQKGQKQRPSRQMHAQWAMPLTSQYRSIATDAAADPVQSRYIPPMVPARSANVGHVPSYLDWIQEQSIDQSVLDLIKQSILDLGENAVQDILERPSTSTNESLFLAPKWTFLQIYPGGPLLSDSCAGPCNKSTNGPYWGLHTDSGWQG